MNPFDDAELAKHYEAWYAGDGRRADVFEKRLLAKLLERFRQARSVLEIGCGTGHFTRWMADSGLEVAGVDASGTNGPRLESKAEIPRRPAGTSACKECE